MVRADYPFPLAVTDYGRLASPDYDEHVRQMIEQLLFTSAGERVNRPGFGTGLQAMVFSGLTAEVAGTTQALVQGALQQWLGDVILVESVTVTAQDTTLTVIVSYVVRRTGHRTRETFFR